MGISAVTKRRFSVHRGMATHLACSLLLCGAVVGCAAEKPDTAEGARSESYSQTAQFQEQHAPDSENRDAVAKVDQPSLEAPSSQYVIELQRSADGDPEPFFEVVGLTESQFDRLADVDWQPADWNSLLAVYVAGQGSAQEDHPAMLGAYRIEARGLRFHPRFPLTAGLRYRAVFNPDRLPNRSGSEQREPDRAGENRKSQPAVLAEFEMPAPAMRRTTVVEHVYPSTNRLPENQLKFYLHFSAPMSRGEAYDRVHLLNGSGEKVDGAFLELGEELWDPEGKRFTLLIDPGRIKRGLKPREDLGPVLEQGNPYTLIVEGDWLDANGNPLTDAYRKEFHVEAPDEEPIDVAAWTIKPAPAGTQKPLTVSFPGPLDHALLERLLTVTDAGGRGVAGAIRVEDGETTWRFTPDLPWKAGRYEIVVETILEDLAGNSIGRPFEVDVFREVQRTVESETVAIPFDVIPETASAAPSASE